MLVLLHSATLQQQAMQALFLSRSRSRTSSIIVHSESDSTKSVSALSLNWLWLWPSVIRPPPLCTPTHHTNARFLDASTALATLETETLK